MKLITKGQWPGPVTLRRGWARAEARPWNDEYSDAHLRLIRGGKAFLADAAHELLDTGAPTVISPPLPDTAQAAWREAGFEILATLSLLRLDLTSAPPGPTHLVQDGDDEDIDAALAIDADAFEPFWRLDRAGFDEALASTPSSSFLVIRNGDGTPCGFAVVGYGAALAYLQRVAVHTHWQGRGMGRSIVRACVQRARARGASALLLNTQAENVSALSLYASEGFVELPRPLALLARTP